jgi:hypothetical protein
MDKSSPSRKWPVRLGWLCVYWIAGVAAMAMVASLLKAALQAVGLAGP